LGWVGVLATVGAGSTRIRVGDEFTFFHEVGILL
jgi:hypothetical protein